MGYKNENMHFLIFLGAPSSLALGSLVGYIMAFSIGWGPIPMLVMSEITPVRARGTASGITVVVAWSSAFIVTKVRGRSNLR